MVTHNHHNRKKTPTDNNTYWFCFIFSNNTQQTSFQASEAKYYVDPNSDNHSEINNMNIIENNNNNNTNKNDMHYIIQKRNNELNFKRSQRDDSIKIKDCNRIQLLEMNEGNDLYEAKEIVSLTNWKSSNVDGQHKYPYPPAPPGVFEDMNQMFHRVGVRFSNSHYDRHSLQSDISNEDINIEAVGDAHLQRLHMACIEKMTKLDNDNDQLNVLGKLDSKLSMPSSSSLATPFLGSSQDFHEKYYNNDNNDTNQNQLLEVVSVALAYSEVLQLQGQTDKAIILVEDVIDKVKKDMKDQTSSTTVSNKGSDSNNTYNWELFDANSEVTCKKLDLLLESHKRLGPLYKIMGDYENAEKHIREFISLAENKSDKITDLAHAYSLLAVVFDGLERLDDAFEADTRALELLETIKVLQREKEMKNSI